MKVIESIPKIWRQAYLLICLWYAINFAISSFFEWKFVNPQMYVLWNGFFLFEALCVFIALIFFWSHFLFRFEAPFQLAGHIAGIVLFFLINGTLSYYFTDYMLWKNWRICYCKCKRRYTILFIQLELNREYRFSHHRFICRQLCRYGYGCCRLLGYNWFNIKPATGSYSTVFNLYRNMQSRQWYSVSHFKWGKSSLCLFMESDRRNNFVNYRVGSW